MDWTTVRRAQRLVAYASAGAIAAGVALPTPFINSVFLIAVWSVFPLAPLLVTVVGSVVAMPLTMLVRRLFGYPLSHVPLQSAIVWGLGLPALLVIVVLVDAASHNSVRIDGITTLIGGAVLGLLDARLLDRHRSRRSLQP